MIKAPLAARLRPKTFDDIVGQRHLFAPGAMFRRMVEEDKLSSIILFGPAGTGKTTVGEVIATHTDSKFVKLNATSATVGTIRKEAKLANSLNKRVVLFVDEVHRFTKTQQDVLLPFVEDGVIILIGATTENPFHTISSALVSRSQLFELEPLSFRDLIALLVRAAVYYRENGRKFRIDNEAVRYIAKVACGDARKAISILEVVVECSEGEDITLEIVQELAPSKYMVFNRKGTEHFDLASAYQGSIQASDPDAAVYWLAKWLESGEDPRYIARRLMVSASEDAAGTPEAAAVAHNAYVAACEIGRPECDIVLAHATVLTASAPRDKSAANAIWAAVADVKNKVDIWVPKEMRDSHYSGAEKLGHGAYKDGRKQDKYVGITKRYYFPRSDDD